MPDALPPLDDLREELGAVLAEPVAPDDPVGRVRRSARATSIALGFERHGRHWVRDGMYVEVPGVTMLDPVEEHRVAGHLLRVVRPEVVLADRIVGFRHWRYTGYAAQALAMLGAFGNTLDERWLRDRLRREGAEDAYDALRALHDSGERLSESDFDALLDSLASPENRERRVKGEDDDRA